MPTPEDNSNATRQDCRRPAELPSKESRKIRETWKSI